MNTKFVASALFAVAALSGASAFAQSGLSGEAALAIRPDVSASNVTRAQVQANYLAARQSGAVAVSPEAAFAAAPVEASTLTRAAVREEARHYVILDGSNRKIYR